MKKKNGEMGALFIHLNANAEDYPDHLQNLFDTILHDFSGLELEFKEDMQFNVGAEIQILDLPFVHTPSYFIATEEPSLVHEPETLKQAVYNLLIDAWEIQNINIADGNVYLILTDTLD